MAFLVWAIELPWENAVFSHFLWCSTDFLLHGWLTGRFCNKQGRFFDMGGKKPTGSHIFIRNCAVFIFLEGLLHQPGHFFKRGSPLITIRKPGKSYGSNEKRNYWNVQLGLPETNKLFLETIHEGNID
jgi:hypothetical protein